MHSHKMEQRSKQNFKCITEFQVYHCLVHGECYQKQSQYLTFDISLCLCVWLIGHQVYVSILCVVHVSSAYTPGNQAFNLEQIASKFNQKRSEFLFLKAFQRFWLNFDAICSKLNAWFPGVQALDTCTTHRIDTYTGWPISQTQRQSEISKVRYCDCFW